MNKNVLLRMLGRKSLTWLSGFAFCLYMNQEFPALVTGDAVLPLAAVMLLAASTAMSIEKDRGLKRRATDPK
jgi:hypothetical protein